MWIYIAVFVISAGLILGLSGCISRIGKTGSLSENDSLYYPSDSAVGRASRADIERRLKVLSESETPKNLNLGAMCYEVALPPDRAEYVCPVCGEKTLYTNDYTYTVLQEISSCRNAVAKIKNIELRLDESRFCKQCTPDTNVKPSLDLYIRYKGEHQELKTENIYSGDLDLIAELMAGNKKHVGATANEDPLKDYIDRLKELLHIDETKK